MPKPKLTIEYCAPCGYLPRTVWQVQELMRELTGSVASVELVPADGGRYRVTLGDTLLFSKEQEGRFPDADELLAAAYAALGETPAAA